MKNFYDVLNQYVSDSLANSFLLRLRLKRKLLNTIISDSRLGFS